MSDGKQTLSVNPVESSPLTTCLSIPNSNIVVLGTLQNEVALYQLSYCRLESVAHVHDDSITTLGDTVYSISSDEDLNSSLMTTV